jgi:hypothetical protein
LARHHRKKSESDLISGGTAQSRLCSRRDRGEIAQRVVGQSPKAIGIDGHREIGREQHDAAVGFGIPDVLDGNACRSAGPVLDDGGRRETTGQLLRENAGEDVRAPAGRKPDNDAQCSRESLCLKKGVSARYHRSGSSSAHDAPTCEHGLMPSRATFPLHIEFRLDLIEVRSIYAPRSHIAIMRTDTQRRLPV